MPFLKRRVTTAPTSGLRPLHPVRVIYDATGAPANIVNANAHPDMFKKTKAVSNAFKKNQRTGKPRALAGLRAEVLWYPDFSISMEEKGRKYYSQKHCGTNQTTPASIMQTMGERFLALGLQADGDGVIQVIPFHHGLLDEIRVGLQAGRDAQGKEVLAYNGVVDTQIWGRYGERGMGGTNYAPVLRDIKKRALASNKLIIAGITTDGGPNDPDDAEEVLCELSQLGVLVKFFGINDVPYLERVDNLEDYRPGARLFDNTDTKIFDGREWPTIFDVTDEQFADAMADEVDKSIADAIEARVLLAP